MGFGRVLKTIFFLTSASNLYSEDESTIWGEVEGTGLEHFCFWSTARQGLFSTIFPYKIWNPIIRTGRSYRKIKITMSKRIFNFEQKF